MEELINLVMQKTNLPREQAEQAVTTVLGFVKQRLPEPLASQLDGLLESDQAGGLMAGLGGLLGR